MGKTRVATDPVTETAQVAWITNAWKDTSCQSTGIDGLLFSIDCAESSFRCANENCVSEETRCSGIDFCGDNSNNFNCTGKMRNF